AGHCDLESDTLVAQQVFDWHAGVFKNHRPRRLRVPTHLALVGAERQSRRAALDHEGRDTGRPLAAAPYHHDVEVATPGTGDELLLTIQHVMIAVTHRAGAQRRGVRSGPRLRQTVARQKLHPAELWQPLLALNLIAVGIDHPGGHV